MTERDEALNDWPKDWKSNDAQSILAYWTKHSATLHAALQSPVPEEWREAVRDLAEHGYAYMSPLKPDVYKKHASVIEAAQKGGGDV